LQRQFIEKEEEGF